MLWAPGEAECYVGRARGDGATHFKAGIVGT